MKEYIAFAGELRLASGPLHTIAIKTKQWLDTHPESTVLVFDSEDSNLIELDLRGSVEEVVARLPPMTQSDAGNPERANSHRRSAGRPKLGVTAREVTLLPRHWDWLKAQPGGASTTLRKLVEKAIHDNPESERIRKSKENCYRFIQAIAGNEPGFEEATRALFAGREPDFIEHTGGWPVDISHHALVLAKPAFR
ncbi:MAG: DUF2239 family protein [Pseudomonadales bacterium]|nr:DUF2239 family protein [Pseudomonadales bacterium]